MDRRTELKARRARALASAKKAATTAKRYNTQGKKHLYDKWKEREKEALFTAAMCERQLLSMWNKANGGR